MAVIRFLGRVMLVGIIAWGGYATARPDGDEEPERVEARPGVETGTPPSPAGR